MPFTAVELTHWKRGCEFGEHQIEMVSIACGIKLAQSGIPSIFALRGQLYRATYPIPADPASAPACHHV